MKILKKENWWVWLLLLFFSGGTSNVVLGALLDVYDKNAWYAKPKNWLIGFLCFVFPLAIMIIVFQIEIMCKVNAKLKTPGSELYLSPYIWLSLVIVPIFGWILFFVLLIYLSVWPIVMLYRGNGEKYIEGK